MSGHFLQVAGAERGEMPLQSFERGAITATFDDRARRPAAVGNLAKKVFGSPSKEFFA